MKTTEVVVLVGAVLCIVPLARPYFIELVMLRLDLIYESMRKERAIRQLSEAEDNDTKAFRILPLALAVVAPVLGSGKFSLEEMNLNEMERAKPNDSTLRGLERNAWIIPYMAAAGCCLWVLIAIGHPYIILMRPRKVIMCLIALLLRSDSDGGLRSSPRTIRQATSLEGILRAESIWERLGSLTKRTA